MRGHQTSMRPSKSSDVIVESTVERRLVDRRESGAEQWRQSPSSSARRLRGPLSTVEAIGLELDCRGSDLRKKCKNSK